MAASLWIYYPNFKSAERYSLAKRSPLDAAISAITTALNLENVEHTFHITGEKSEKGYDLELTPRNPSMKRIFQKLLLHLSNDLFAEHTDIAPKFFAQLPNFHERLAQSFGVPGHSTFVPKKKTELTVDGIE